MNESGIKCLGAGGEFCAISKNDTFVLSCLAAAFCLVFLVLVGYKSKEVWVKKKIKVMLHQKDLIMTDNLLVNKSPFQKSSYRLLPRLPQNTDPFTAALQSS